MWLLALVVGWIVVAVVVWALLYAAGESPEPTEAIGQGTYHHDEREPLAYAYDGTLLVAAGYREEIVEYWEDATDYDVVRTPEGEP